MIIIIKKIIKFFLNNLFNIDILNFRSRNKNSKFNFFIEIFSYFKNYKIIIFDVGANAGQSTDFFLKILEKIKIINYEIHIFEPDYNLFKNLKKKFFLNKKIFLNNIGLGSKIEKKFFNIYESSTKNSFYEIDFSIKQKKKEKISVFVSTVDEYCKKKRIKKIDILKLNVEGFETNCLFGSKSMIKKDKINLIYTSLSIGKFYKNINQDIYDIEKLLFRKYQLIGIDTNRNFSEIVGCINNWTKVLHLNYLYLNKKIYY
jgi:FkbM family methyltransferase